MWSKFAECVLSYFRDSLFSGLRDGFRAHLIVRSVNRCESVRLPGRVLADLMGHAKVDTSLNVYAQVIDGAKRSAAEKVSGGLFTIVHSGQGAQELTR